MKLSGYFPSYVDNEWATAWRLAHPVEAQAEADWEAKILDYYQRHRITPQPGDAGLYGVVPYARDDDVMSGLLMNQLRCCRRPLAWCRSMLAELAASCGAVLAELVAGTDTSQTPPLSQGTTA